MLRRFGSAAVGVALVFGVTGVTGVAGAEPDRPELRQAMAALAGSGAAGVQVRVHDERGDWVGAAGVRELSGGTVPTNGRFRAGSITKTFVATVVLQLVDEGAVGLDDSVAGYLPTYRLDPRITVRMLLQHTSGLFNYTGEPNPDGTFEPGIPLQGKEYERNRFRTYRPEELTGLALSRPARFEPGTSYSYSNTGYILLGELVERLTRTPYAFQVWQRILRPLRLHDTLLPGSWTGVPGPHAHAYYAYRHQDRLRVLDVTRANLTWGGAAGEIISTTRDLDRFVTALLGGALLPPDLLAEMREQVPIPEGGGYGLGLAVFDAGPACGGVFYGHDGGLPGYLSYMLSTSDRGKRIELSVTLGALDVGDPQAVQRFFIALNGVVAAALCQDPRSADLKTLDHDLVGGLAVTGR